MLRGGLAASVLLHLLIVAVLFVQMPVQNSQPEPEESVAVEIVPPPEEEETSEEEAPEPQPQPQPEEEAELVPEPEPPKAEQAEVAPPPPPPSLESVPTPPERPVEQPPVEEAAGRQVPPMPMLRPVFEFGEKDSGPREDTSGNAAQEAAKVGDVPPEEPETPAEASDSSLPEDENAAEADQPPGTPPPDDIALPQVDTGTPGADADGEKPADQPSETMVTLAPEPPAENPEQPADTPDAPATTAAEVAETVVELDEVKTLYSTNITGDAAAVTAMNDIPRPDRADQLCVTELREQLRNGTPAYWPELLPSFRLQDGDVLAVNKAAFRANGQWFDLRFRCEINPDATRVLSFGFEVGKPIPKSEWKRYGFPDF